MAAGGTYTHVRGMVDQVFWERGEGGGLLRVAGGEYTTYFRSVIAFGKAGIVQGEERLKAFRALVEKYCGDQSKATNDRAVAGCTRAVIIAIEIEHLTGKESAE